MSIEDKGSLEWDVVLNSETCATLFHDWNERSSVRCKPAKYDCTGISSNDLSKRHWFVPHALSYLDHPAVVSLGPLAVQTLEGRFLVNFLEYTSLLEHKVVNRSAEVIAHGMLLVPLPRQTRLDALKLYTDEGYHSYFSAIAAVQVADVLGLPLGARSNRRINNLVALVEGLPLEMQPIAHFAVGFVCETVITKEFLKFTEGVLVEPIYRVLRDHLEDEWIHGRYFASLFRYVWPRLSDAEQVFTAALLSKVILECFTIDADWLSRSLLDIGVKHDDVFEIVASRSSMASTQDRARRGASATVHALTRANFFGNRRFVDDFREKGLIS